MCAAPAGKLHVLCFFIVQYRIHALPDFYWCPRLLSSEGILAGACVVPSAAALAVPVETGQERGQSGGTGSDFSVFRRCITSTHFRCGLGSNEDDGVSSRFGDFIPIDNFLVKTRGCGGCSQWEGGVERNLGPVASTWPQACT